MDVVMEKEATEKLKINEKNNIVDLKFIPVIKRARTKKLAFLFNLAARLLAKDNRLVICLNYAYNTYFMSINEVLYLKKLYGNWLLAYIKGYTNEKPSFTALAAKTGYTYAQVQSALNNHTSHGYTLTYKLMKQWGYIYES